MEQDLFHMIEKFLLRNLYLIGEMKIMKEIPPRNNFRNREKTATSQPNCIQVSGVRMQLPRDLLFETVTGLICVQVSLFVYSSESLLFLLFKITKTIPHGQEIRGGNDFLKLLFLSVRQIFHQPSKQPITHHKFLCFKTNSPDNTGQWFPNQF